MVGSLSHEARPLTAGGPRMSKGKQTSARSRGPLSVVIEPRPATLDDESIVVGVRRGDEPASEALYWRVRPATDLALVTVLGRREGEHEDLVQDTLERVVATIVDRRFALACSLPTWASRIATNLALSLLRKRRTERTRLGYREPEEALRELISRPDPERDAEDRSQAACVRRALECLESTRAETLVLHDVLGHELSEIAAMHGCSVAAAQSRLVRGRKELVERVEGKS